MFGKIMVAIFIIFIVVAGLSSLGKNDGTAVTPEQQQALVTDNVLGDLSRRVFYVIDPRTGVCLVRSHTTRGFRVYSPVECTDRVMNNVLNKQK